jgi:hypothetical protein
VKKQGKEISGKGNIWERKYLGKEISGKGNIWIKASPPDYY